MTSTKKGKGSQFCFFGGGEGGRVSLWTSTPMNSKSIFLSNLKFPNNCLASITLLPS